MKYVIIQLMVSLLLLVSAITAYSYPNTDSIFSEPLQKPIEIERTIYAPTSTFGALAYMGLGGSYEKKTVVEQQMNVTLIYPFVNTNVTNTGEYYDLDDLYLIRNYDITGLIKCGKNAASINDIYNCTAKFNLELYKQNKGNCRTSTSAFKIAFLNSELAASNNGFKLMKAYTTGSNYNAHRFIVLSNKNGNFAIDPYWGIFEDMDTAVKNYSDSFYNNETSANYRGNVYKLDYFYNA